MSSPLTPVLQALKPRVSNPNIARTSSQEYTSAGRGGRSAATVADIAATAPLSVACVGGRVDGGVREGIDFVVAAPHARSPLGCRVGTFTKLRSPACCSEYAISNMLRLMCYT